jgi:hypothetical protein
MNGVYSHLYAQCTIINNGPLPLPEMEMYNCGTGICNSPQYIDAPWQAGHGWLLQVPVMEPGVQYVIDFSNDPVAQSLADSFEITVFNLLDNQIEGYTPGLILTFQLPGPGDYAVTISWINSCGSPPPAGPFLGFDVDANCPLPCIFCPLEGDLVITEIMHTPDAVPDQSGEYFEIMNVSGAPIDLLGMEIFDDGTNGFVINAPLVINPGDFAVFAPELDPLLNGGLLVDYQYDFLAFQLADTFDAIFIYCDGNFIDGVVYDNGFSYPNPIGASMSIDPESIHHLANDLGDNWCTSTTSYGSGGLGTPGLENISCSKVTMSVTATKSVKKCDCCDEEGGSGSQGGNHGG